MKPVISSGLKIAVDLNSNNKVTAYKAKKEAPITLIAAKIPKSCNTSESKKNKHKYFTKDWLIHLAAAGQNLQKSNRKNLIKTVGKTSFLENHLFKNQHRKTSTTNQIPNKSSEIRSDS